MTGTLMAVSDKGKTVYTAVGDRGPRSMIGECAVSVALALGIPPSPVSGGTPYGVVYTVFPGSAVPAPKDDERLLVLAAALFVDLQYFEKKAS